MKLVSILLILPIVLILSGCRQHEKAELLNLNQDIKSVSLDNNSEVAATYKNGQVTQDELQKFIDALIFINPKHAMNKDVSAFREFVLKQLVMTRILNARATENSKNAAEAKVQQQMDLITQIDAPNKEQLDNNLKAANLGLTDIEQYFRMTFTTVEDMSSRVTEQKVRDSYDKVIKENPNAFAVATLYHILIGLKDPTDPTQQIDIRTKEEALIRAQEVKEKLTKGDDFAVLAKEYSDDPGSKDQGGKYENVEIYEFVPEFAKSAMELPLNTVSEPVATNYGYHIMKVESRRMQTFDDVKSYIRFKLADELINEFMIKEYPSYHYKSNI